MLPRLVSFLRPEWPRLVTVLVLSACWVLSFTIGPWLLGVAVNLLTGSHTGKAAGLATGAGVDFTPIGRVLGLAALVFLLGFLISCAQGYLLTGVVQRTAYRLRLAAGGKLARLPLRYFDSHPHGEVLSRVSNDIDNLGTSLQDGLGQLISGSILLVSVTSLMFVVSPLLAGGYVASNVLAVVVSIAIARRSRVQFIAQWTQTGKLNGFIEETYSGRALVQAFGQHDRVIEEFGEQNGLLRQASFRARFLTGIIESIMPFIGNFNYVLIAVFGGLQMAVGAISLGSVLALIQYSRLSSGSMSQIVGQINLAQSGLVSAERVFGFLDEPEEPVLGHDDPGAAITRPRRAAGRVELRHVAFRYEPDRPLIEDFSLTAAPGQTVAIVGPTGAGKTTIVNLLMRFYEISGGQILLDGIDYRDLSREQVRSGFGMVLQDAWLFAGTIRDNIAYGREGAQDEEIVAAARMAHVDQFVRTLPQGYGTVLDGDASGISSGQKQLLTVARAFLADPAILILDEATSSVDSRTEILIRDAMKRLRAGRTSFVIAHRLSTIRDADVILVMDAGRIVEQGTHRELLCRAGFYYRLYHSQFAAGAGEIAGETVSSSST